ncbi:MarR family winged helix-turn-helix transcriptional regulator [Mechercharimyces sp. CAU 1602]|uniref:MarR family winged helix-turn-helix transcriptional regulator n=1 Tax=Mechercharimyces sp. CAU 1602 TaxID=2973933 RepID=UPI0021631279|nr:MarR family transcriptional regulator [Mechercharimyces sp. CAU 1602]MCS1352096.1 MarR family transcriptional regulator [Mechercharimyces sp. CAU 1602]
MNEAEGEIALKLFVVLFRSQRALEQRVAEDIRSHGFNMTEFAVLELLYHKGDQPIQKIGGQILISSGTMTYVVDKLEKKGLLERVSCPKDRRVTYASITDRGKEVMREIFPQHQALIEKIFVDLSTAEKETMINLLKNIGYRSEQI